MIEVPYTCAGCGRSLLMAVGEAVWQGRLVWWAAYTCVGCAQVLELDDLGGLPPPYRQRVLEQFGRWRLRGLEPKGPGWLRLAGFLRFACGLSLGSIPNLRDALRLGKLTGTSAEMRWLEHHATRFGLSSVLEPWTGPDEGLDVSTLLPFAWHGGA